MNFKGFHTDEQCIACGWCLKNCPTYNIVMKDGVVQFKGDCLICMRCYNFCPRHDIQMTRYTINNKKYKRYGGPRGLGCKSKFRNS